MTQMQVDYQKALETKRANVARENLQAIENLVKSRQAEAALSQAATSARMADIASYQAKQQAINNYLNTGLRSVEGLVSQFENVGNPLKLDFGKNGSNMQGLADIVRLIASFA